MLTAQIVDPFKRKAKIKCFACGLSYSGKDYGILYQNEKLAFFKIKFPEQRKKIYCHECLYKTIVKQMGPLPEIEVRMITMEGDVVVAFSKDP